MTTPITVVTGATGFLGSAVVERLIRAGYHCHVISRNPERARTRLPSSVTAAAWGAPLPGATHNIIHLAGESVAGIWTPRKRRNIIHSRTSTLGLLSDQIRALPLPPAALVSASAVGYYGDRPGEQLTESSAPDPHRRFRCEVCDRWEIAARTATAGLPTRLVMLRYGNILSPTGGLLGAFLTAFRHARTVAHLGEPGTIKPWISLRDAASLTVHSLRTELAGPVNATSPSASTSAELYQCIAKHLGLSRHITIPPRLAKLAMGELVHAFTEDQHVLPLRALADGFRFTHPTLQDYFASLHSPARP